MLTTQRQIRAQFWLDHPHLSRRPAPAGSQRGSGRLYRRLTQNDYSADTRMAFCDFVEVLERNRIISEELAQRATL